MISLLFFCAKIYLLIKFIEEPTPQNYLLFVIFLNLFFFGYTWAFYVTLTCVGIFLIEDKKTVIHVFNTYVIRYPYLVKITDVYKHPTTQFCIQTIKHNGDQLVSLGRWIMTVVLYHRHPESIHWLNILKKIM